MSHWDEIPSTFTYKSPGRMLTGEGGHPAQPHPTEPQCEDCRKFDKGRCDILGEITPQALAACKDVGYWDTYCRPRIHKPVYRHTLHTGVWAEILEGK